MQKAICVKCVHVLFKQILLYFTIIRIKNVTTSISRENIRYRWSQCLITAICLSTMCTFMLMFGSVFHYMPYELQTCDNCFERPYTFTYNPADTCTDVNVDYIIMIFSRCTNFESRAVVRDTWLAKAHKLPDVHLRHVFLLGLPRNSTDQMLIEKEARLYGDIVQQNFMDTYYNLTLKSLQGLEWASHYCAQAKFIIKIDEDVYANVSLLISAIQQTQSADFNMLGRCLENGRPFRNPFSRYYVSRGEYRFSLYPPFCTGPVYMMPMRVATAILAASPNVPFFKLEDVYIAMCLFVTPYGLISIQELILNTHKLHNSSCSDLETIAAIHSVTPDWLSEIWQRCTLHYYHDR